MRLTLTFILSLFVGIVYAQVPQGVGYQGVATDSEGIELVNQAISIRASILSGSVNGTVEWQEVHDTTTDDFGLFALTIGEGNNTGGGMLPSFADIPWGESTYFLQIEMDATGGMDYSLMGVNQMMSVPYALYAESTNLDYDSIANYLSGDSTFVTNISNGLGGGGCDFNYPDGFDGQPVHIDLMQSDYTVPSGKSFYIQTSYKTGNSYILLVNGMEVFSAQTDILRGNVPFIVKAGDIISHQPSGSYSQATLSGLLIEENVDPIYIDLIQSDYTVPSGKNFYIQTTYTVGNACIILVNGMEVTKAQSDPLNDNNPLIVKSGDVISHQPTSSYSRMNISGYLADEDYFADCGGGGGSNDGGNSNTNDGEEAITLQNCNNQIAITYHDYEYDLVGIGNQCWFAENLRTKKFNNGEDIPENILSNDNDYYEDGLNPIGYGYPCVNSTFGPGAIQNEISEYWYGLVYTGMCTINDNICPTGFHVPTMNDFEELIDNFDDNNVLTGMKLLAEPPWAYGTNESGFNTKLVGPVNHQGCDTNDKAKFLSSEITNIQSNGTEKVGYLEIEDHGLIISNYSGMSAVEWASSVRCIMD